MPDDERRYRTTYHGYTIEEMTPNGGAKVMFRSAGCTWEDAPASVHLSLQAEEAKMGDALRKLGAEQYEKRKRKSQ